MKHKIHTVQKWCVTDVRFDIVTFNYQRMHHNLSFICDMMRMCALINAFHEPWNIFHFEDNIWWVGCIYICLRELMNGQINWKLSSVAFILTSAGNNNNKNENRGKEINVICENTQFRKNDQQPLVYHIQARVVEHTQNLQISIYHIFQWTLLISQKMQYTHHNLP